MPASLRRPCLAQVYGAAVATVFLVATEARADALDLTWTAPASCPDRDAVLHELAQLAPTSLTARMNVQAVVTQESKRVWSVRLEIQAGQSQGERVLHAESCRLLVRAAALVIALALRSEPAAPVAVPPPPPPPPHVESALEPEVDAPRQPVVYSGEQATPRASPEHPRLLLRALAEGELGILPNPSWAFGLAAGVHYGALRLELAATSGLGQTRAVPGASDGARVQLQTPILGRLRGCYGWRFDRVEADACLGAEGADVTGASAGISSPARGSAFWLGVFAGGGLGVRIAGPLSVRLDLEAGGSPHRPEFVIAPYGEVYAPSLVYGGISLGPEVELP